MKQTVNEYMFVEAFRQIRPDNFSYKGLQALFEYLEEYEDDIGEEIDFDVIGLCCEFQEYENLDEFREAYGEEYESLEAVEDRTAVIRIPDSERFIIQIF